MPARNFWNAFKQKVMGFLGRIVTGDETWVHYHQPEIKKASKEWCRTSSPKTKKFRTQPSAAKDMLTLLGWTRGNFGALHAQDEHCDQCNVCRSPQQSPVSCHQDQICGHLSTGVLLQHDSARPILPVQLLQQSKICPSSVFHIRRTRQTSPQVIFTSLGHSKGRWEASLSGPTKRCSRQCTIGCTLSQNTFFLEVFMHFWSAGTIVWNAMETT